MGPQKINKVSINDLTKNDPFAIKNFIMGDNSMRQPDIEYKQPRILDGISFVICLRGHAKIRINIKEHELSDNCILTILPHQIVEVVGGSEDLLLEILFFSFDFIADLPLPKDYNIPQTINKCPCIKISKEVMQDLLEYHAFIAKQYNMRDDPSIFRVEIIKGLLYSLLLRIGTIYMSTESVAIGNNLTTHQEDLAERFLILLKEHHKERRDVSFYADKMCLTSKYLSTTIKKVTGKSISSWITDVIMMEAKIMLKASDMTVSQISDELNFPNSSFFGRLFKQRTGMTPLEFRAG